MKLQPDDRLLNVWEVGALLGRKPSTVRKDIHLKKFPTVRVGRQVRVPLSAVQAMIEAGYTPAVTR